MKIYKSDISKDVKQPVSHTGGGSGIYANQGEISVGGMNLATQTWIEDNYISKKFFNKLFLVHGDGTTSIEANDLSTAIESLEAKIGIWTNSYISALGQNSSQGGGSGTSYNRLDTWSSYDSTKSGWVLSALLGNDLNSRLTTLENGVAPISHTHAWSDITNTPTTLNGYGITDAYISNGVIRLGSQSITPLTSHQSLAGYATESWVTSNYSSKSHTHSVKINGVTKTIAATGGTAVDFGSYLPLSGGTMSSTNVVTNLNADLLDGYHAEDISKLWYTLQQYFDGSTAPWWYKIYTKTSTTYDDIENDWMIEISAYSDQNHASHMHGYLRATYYKSSVNIVLSTDPSCNVGTSLQLRAAIDSNGDVWLGLIANYLGGLCFRVLHEGANNHVIRSGWAMQRTDPSDTYIVNNGALSPAHIQGVQKMYLTNVVSDYAGKLATSRTLWGQSFDGSANVSGNLTFMTGSNGMYGIIPNQSGNWDLSIYTEGQPRLTIKDDGNVGIGTSTPQAELDVNGNALIGGTLYISTGGYHESVSRNMYSVISVPDNYHKFILRGDVTTTAQNSYTTGDVTTFAEYGGKWRFRRLTESENTILVELGTTSTFNGNINASGTIHSTTGIYSEGYVSALGQNTSSDARLKDVQGDVDLSIDMLANAPSKAFVWKENKALGEQVGTIAQYWQKALPQVVHENNGYLAMQYDVAALLGVISVAKNVKSHEERIAELERENRELKKELKELKYERN